MTSKNTHRIRQLYWLTDQTMTQALAEMDLTASQGSAMAFISHQSQPPLTKDFEETFNLSHSCASGILNRLKKKAFIQFQLDPQDKRCKRIYILPKGQQCHAHMHKTMDHINQQMVQDFTDEEQALFSQLLDRAIANMGNKHTLPLSKEETETK